MTQPELVGVYLCIGATVGYLACRGVVRFLRWFVEG